MTASLLLIEFEKLEQRSGRDSAVAAATRFMLSYLSLHVEGRPEPAETLIHLARQSECGTVDVVKIESAIKAAWSYLDERGIAYDAGHRNNTVIRAALCLIEVYRDPSVDIVELLTWFLELLDRIDDRSMQVPELIAAALGQSEK